jgi:hypothetical protein
MEAETGPGDLQFGRSGIDLIWRAKEIDAEAICSRSLFDGEETERPTNQSRRREGDHR